MTGTFLVVAVSCTNRCLFYAGRLLCAGRIFISMVTPLAAVFTQWSFSFYLAGRFYFIWLVVFISFGWSFYFMIPNDTSWHGINRIRYIHRLIAERVSHFTKAPPQHIQYSISDNIGLLHSQFQIYSMFIIIMQTMSMSSRQRSLNMISRFARSNLCDLLVCFTCFSLVAWPSC